MMTVLYSDICGIVIFKNDFGMGLHLVVRKTNCANSRHRYPLSSGNVWFLALELSVERNRKIKTKRNEVQITYNTKAQ
jgi:hypothetical protein